MLAIQSCLRWVPARPSAYPNLPKLTPPTLLLHGSHDLLCPVEWAHWEKRQAVRGKLVVVPGGATASRAAVPTRPARTRFAISCCAESLPSSGNATHGIHVLWVEVSMMTRLTRNPLIVVAAALAVAVVVTGAVLLRPDAAAEPPAGVDPVATSPDELVGTWRPTWIADYSGLDASRPDPPHLSFTADRWHGSDGCNGLGGEYDADLGQLSADTSGYTTAMACNNVPNDEVLAKTEYFRIGGATLNLYDAAWTRLATYERTR
jgi:heat shock protein HslJ